MTREEEIVNAAKRHENETKFGELVNSPLSRGVNSAYGIGFIEGCVWADKTMIKNICEWLNDHVNDYIFNDKEREDQRDWLKIRSDCFDDLRKAMSNNDSVDACDTCKDNQYCSKSDYVKSHCYKRQ